MNQSQEPADSFWDLLIEIANLQSQLGRDLVAWAQAHEAGSRAFQATAETLRLMAQTGRRMERYTRTGPPAAVREAMQFFFNPLQSMGATQGGPSANPFARFWETWAAAPRPTPPPSSASAEGEQGP